MNKKTLRNFASTSLVLVLVVLSLSACTESGGSGSTNSDSSKAEPKPPPPPEPKIKLSVGDADVVIDQKISLTVDDSVQEIKEVKVRGERRGDKSQFEDKNVKLKGALTDGTWTANSFLEPSTNYNVRVTFVNGDSITKPFSTKELSLKKQTYPSIFPGKGMVVGQGQVVAIRFDLPVTDRAAVEKNLVIKSEPEQVGSWNWISANEVRYRPKSYWQPGTKVSVKVNINSVSVGKGIYGQFNRTTNFKITNNSRVIKVNVSNYTLKAYKNGKLVKTLPISAGKSGSDPGFITRSGTKLIMSKSRYVNMNSATIGIDPAAPEGYDLDNVEYALRLTNSGEFFHAAPWNTAFLGRSNQSHGCTGMSTAGAAWLYNFVEAGDPVVYTGSNRGMTLDNGFGDWNVSWNKYKAGSAL